MNQRFHLDIDGRQVLTDAAVRTSMPGIGKIAWYANAAARGGARRQRADLGRSRIHQLTS